MVSTTNSNRHITSCTRQFQTSLLFNYVFSKLRKAPRLDDRRGQCFSVFRASPPSVGDTLPHGVFWFRPVSCLGDICVVLSLHEF